MFSDQDKSVLPPLGQTKGLRVWGLMMIVLLVAFASALGALFLLNAATGLSIEAPVEIKIQ